MPFTVAFAKLESTRVIKICKYVICLPTEHQGVTTTGSEMFVHFKIELEFGNVAFCVEGNTGGPGEKPLGAE